MFNSIIFRNSCTKQQTYILVQTTFTTVLFKVYYPIDMQYEHDLEVYEAAHDSLVSLQRFLQTERAFLKNSCILKPKQ